LADVDALLAQRVIAKVAEAGHLEPALGMLSQWLERHTERPDEIRDVAARLAVQAASSDDSIVEYYLDRLVDSGLLDDELLAVIWSARLRHSTGLVDALDRKLTRKSLDIARRPCWGGSSSSLKRRAGARVRSVCTPPPILAGLVVPRRPFLRTLSGTGCADSPNVSFERRRDAEEHLRFG
jgi:hypothetical protein